MVMCNCIVQAGQISPESEAVLRKNLNAFAERVFGESAEIGWMEIPQEGGFTASKPSTSSIVSMRAPAPVAQADREGLLRELCGIWTSETKCPLDEVVGVLSDPVAN